MQKRKHGIKSSFASRFFRGLRTIFSKLTLELGSSAGSEAQGQGRAAGSLGALEGERGFGGAHGDTVDGCEILNQIIGGKHPIISYYFQAFYHPRWCRISSSHSRIGGFQRIPEDGVVPPLRQLPMGEKQLGFVPWGLPPARVMVRQADMGQGGSWIC
jgi:hypothetical protein